MTVVRRGNSGTPLLPIVLGFTGAAVVAGLAIYAVMAEDPPRLDRLTNCPLEVKLISGHSALVLDRTEGFNAVQKDAIRIALRKQVEGAAPYERVTLSELLSRESLSNAPVAVACNPTRPGDPDSVARKVESDPFLEKKRFEDRFVNRVMKVLDEKLDVPAQQDSPIMEMIQAVNVRELKSAPHGSRKKLVLVSDMMQHSPEYSHYRMRPGRDFFDGSFFRRVSTDLTDVEVHIYYVLRGGSSSEQPAGHREFWHEYFQKLGARAIVFLPVEGAGWVQNK